MKMPRFFGIKIAKIAKMTKIVKIAKMAEIAENAKAKRKASLAAPGPKPLKKNRTAQKCMKSLGFCSLKSAICRNSTF